MVKYYGHKHRLSYTIIHTQHSQIQTQVFMFMEVYVVIITILFYLLFCLYFRLSLYRARKSIERLAFSLFKRYSTF